MNFSQFTENLTDFHTVLFTCGTLAFTAIVFILKWLFEEQELSYDSVVSSKKSSGVQKVKGKKGLNNCGKDNNTSSNKKSTSNNTNVQKEQMCSSVSKHSTKTEKYSTNEILVPENIFLEECDEKIDHKGDHESIESCEINNNVGIPNADDFVVNGEDLPKKADLMEEVSAAGETATVESHEVVSHESSADEGVDSEEVGRISSSVDLHVASNPCETEEISQEPSNQIPVQTSEIKVQKSFSSATTSVSKVSKGGKKATKGSKQKQIQKIGDNIEPGVSEGDENKKSNDRPISQISVEELISLVKRISISDDNAQSIIDILLIKQTNNIRGSSGGNGSLDDSWHAAAAPNSSSENNSKLNHMSVDKLKKDICVKQQTIADQLISISNVTDKLTQLRSELNENKSQLRLKCEILTQNQSKLLESQNAVNQLRATLSQTSQKQRVLEHEQLPTLVDKVTKLESELEGCKSQHHNQLEYRVKNLNLEWNTKYEKLSTERVKIESQLEKKLSEANERIEKLQAQSETHKAIAEKNQQNLESLTEQHASTQKTLKSELNNSETELHLTKTKLKETLEKHKISVDKISENHEVERAKYETKIKILENQVSEKSKKVDKELQESFQKTEEKLKTSNVEVQNLQSKLKMNSSEYEKISKSLKNQISKLENEKEMLENKIEKQTSEFEKVKSNKQNEHSKLESELTSKFNFEKQKFEIKISALTEQNKKVTVENDALIAKLNSEKVELETKLKELKVSSSNKQADLDSKSKFETQISKLNLEKHEVESKLKETNSDHKKVVKSFENEIKSLKSSLDVQKSSLSKLEDVKMKLEKENGIFKGKCDDLSSEIKKFNSSVKKAEKSQVEKIHELESQLHEMESLKKELVVQKTKNDEIRQKNYSVMEALKAKENDHVESKKRLDDMIKKKDELSEKLQCEAETNASLAEKLLQTEQKFQMLSTNNNFSHQNIKSPAPTKGVSSTEDKVTNGHGSPRKSSSEYEFEDGEIIENSMLVLDEEPQIVEELDTSSIAAENEKSGTPEENIDQGGQKIANSPSQLSVNSVNSSSSPNSKSNNAAKKAKKVVVDIL